MKHKAAIVLLNYIGEDMRENISLHDSCETSALTTSRLLKNMSTCAAYIEMVIEELKEN